MSSKIRITNKQYLIIFAGAASIFAIATAGFLTGHNAASMDPGTDHFDSQALIIVMMDGHTMPIHLSGPTQVMRGQQVMDTIPIEIIELSLMSTSPVMIGNSFFDVFVRQSPNMHSMGEIRMVDGFGMADSFFDVFTEIELQPVDGATSLQQQGSQMLCNTEALHLEAHGINHIPPTGSPYVSDGKMVPLVPCDNPKQEPVAFLTYAYHLPGTNEDLKVEIKKELRGLEETGCEGTLKTPKEPLEVNVIGSDDLGQFKTVVAEKEILDICDPAGRLSSSNEITTVVEVVETAQKAGAGKAATFTEKKQVEQIVCVKTIGQGAIVGPNCHVIPVPTVPQVPFRTIVSCTPVALEDPVAMDTASLSYVANTPSATVKPVKQTAIKSDIVEKQVLDCNVVAAGGTLARSFFDVYTIEEILEQPQGTDLPLQKSFEKVVCEKPAEGRSILTCEIGTSSVMFPVGG